MSQAHIPQPNSDGGAPAEQVGSTESAPTGVEISGIGNRGAPPVEVTQHTLAHNGVDPILYQQFIFNSVFTWTTSDQRGKLLWSMPISPKYYNKITERLSTIYNAWGGGVDINVKIAGTGFHAGALVFVRIPPNYDPADFTVPYSWSAFEYRFLDAKTLEVASFHCGDQRQMNYHYTAPEPGSPKSYDIGGTIACYVYLGLNTATSSTQQIEVSVFTRLGQDFKFSQLRVPRLETDEQIEVIPDSLVHALNFSANHTPILGAATLTSMIHMIYSPTTQHVHAVGNVHFDSEVQVYGPRKPSYPPNKYWYGTFEVFPGGSDRWWVSMSESQFWLPQVLLGYKYKIYYNGAQVARNAFTIDDPQPFIANDNRIGISFPKTGIPDEWKSGSPALVSIETNTHTSKTIAHGTWAPPISESPVTFGNDPDTEGEPQMLTVATVLRGGAMKSFPPGYAVSLTVIDTVEDLPIGLLKLYPNGLMTTRKVTAVTYTKLNRIRLVPQSIIRTVDPIPSSSEMSKNRLLLAPIHMGLRQA